MLCVSSVPGVALAAQPRSQANSPANQYTEVVPKVNDGNHTSGAAKHKSTGTTTRPAESTTTSAGETPSTPAAQDTTATVGAPRSTRPSTTRPRSPAKPSPNPGSRPASRRGHVLSSSRPTAQPGPDRGRRNRLGRRHGRVAAGDSDLGVGDRVRHRRDSPGTVATADGSGGRPAAAARRRVAATAPRDDRSAQLMGAGPGAGSVPGVQQRWVCDHDVWPGQHRRLVDRRRMCCLGPAAGHPAKDPPARRYCSSPASRHGLRLASHGRSAVDAASTIWRWSTATSESWCWRYRFTASAKRHCDARWRRSRPQS